MQILDVTILCVFLKAISAQLFKKQKKVKWNNKLYIFNTVKIKHFDIDSDFCLTTLTLTIKRKIN